MSTVVKVRSTTVMRSHCGCGKIITYRAFKTYPSLGKPFYYKMTWLGAWRLDNHYYQCEVAQDES
jgi:hypothetical protein